jgi:hypothetical protein
MAHKVSQLDDKMSASIASLEEKMDGRFATVREEADARFSALNGKYESLNDRIASIQLWALLLYGALAATLLGTMARGFGWM